MIFPSYDQRFVTTKKLQSVFLSFPLLVFAGIFCPYSSGHRSWGNKSNESNRYWQYKNNKPKHRKTMYILYGVLCWQTLNWHAICGFMNGKHRNSKLMKQFHSIEANPMILHLQKVHIKLMFVITILNISWKISFGWILKHLTDSGAALVLFFFGIVVLATLNPRWLRNT